MKKINRILSISGLLTVLFLSFSCKKFLKQQVFTQYDPSSFLKTEQGINSVLNAAYSDLDANEFTLARYFYTLNEFPGDIMWEFGGGAENRETIYMNLKWDPQEGTLSSIWKHYYRGISNANSLLDNIHLAKPSLQADKIKEFKAEARFIRAADYYFLWNLFGPVPLITTTDTIDLQPKRPTDEAFDRFITHELQSAAKDLPLTQEEWGRATKGASLALLGEYYLNTHQWQKAADINKQVMDLNLYSLYTGDIKYQFAVKNEENSSVIFVSPALPSLHGISCMTSTFPPKYPIQSNWMNYGAQWCIYNNWFKTYNSKDKRLEWFVSKYTDVGGVVHNLLDPSDPGRSVRCFKYYPDPNAIGAKHGNDVPYIRYAEVLLNRSEALNQLNGPNQESIDLLNKIRNRAGIPVYNLSDFPTKESFADALLKERGWEFVAEGKRRRDLIRHEKFISKAEARGVQGAKKYRDRYPIPQNEIDANPNLKQNPGY